MKASEISERRNQIVELLKEKKFLKITEAVKLLDVSHETVRQDFNYLEKRGLLKKVYGGAQLAENAPTDDLPLRETSHYADKLAIAREALKLIPAAPCTIGLDSGSTVALLAAELKSLPPKTIFTNSWASMTALLDSGHDLYFSGGRLIRSDMSFHGNITRNAFENIAMDLCFMGSSGVWNHEGICSATYPELDVKRQFIRRSATKGVLMDSSKFATSSFVEVAKWNEIDILITDSHIAAEMKARLERELKVITPDSRAERTSPPPSCRSASSE